MFEGREDATSNMKPSKRTLWIVVLVVAVAALLLWRGSRPSQTSTDVVSNDEGSTGTPTAPTPPRRPVPVAVERRVAAISGTVTVERGAPLAGAQVCAFLGDPTLATQREVPCAVTTVDGRYRIEGLAPALYDVTASAPGHLAARFVAAGRFGPGVRLASGQQREGVDIVLRSGGVEVFGVVRDIAGGEIAGARVRQGFVGERDSVPTIATADGEGRFSLWVGGSTIGLLARAEGYADENVYGPAPGTFFEVFMTPEAVVVGRVMDGDVAVLGARVEVDGRVVLTGADGRFRIDGLMPGVYKPTAKADEGYGEAEASVHLGLGETSEEIVVRLHPAVSVSGVVTIREGEATRPCEEGGASLTPVPDDGWSNLEGRGTAEGRVEFLGVLPGRYLVSAYCSGFVHEASYGEIDVGDDGVEGLVWEVRPGSAIRGRVLASAERLRSIRVDARVKVTGRERAFGASSAELGDDGSFEVVGLPSATYELTLRGDDVPWQNEGVEVEVAEGEDVEGVELRAPAVATVRGRILDERGEPVAGASVRARGAAGDLGYATTDDEGRFEVRGLKGGEYRVDARFGRLTLRRPGTTDDDPQGETVTVDAGDVVDIELVVEARDLEISGVVVDASGGPVPDAFIRAERVPDAVAANSNAASRQARWGGWSQQPLMTDTDGAFTLGGLSAGRYTLWAIREGGGEGVVDEVVAGSEGVSIALQPGGRIEGSVRTASGAAPQRFHLDLRDARTGFSRRDTFFATEGRFVMDEVPPGTYVVSVSSGEGTGDAQASLDLGGVVTGVKVELQRWVRVVGRVVDLETGAPVAGVAVSISRRRSGDLDYDDRRALTDDDGRYEIDAAPVGPAIVLLVPTALEYPTSIANLVVEEGAPYRAPDVEVIAGRLKKGEHAGDLGFTLRATEPDVDPNDRPLVVGFVRPGGPAADAGLKVGDTIVAVDGHDVRGERTPRYPVLVDVPVGATVSLETDAGDTVTIIARNAASK